jgi:uncharacterized membrane protein (DUF441 family)
VVSPLQERLFRHGVAVVGLLIGVWWMVLVVGHDGLQALRHVPHVLWGLCIAALDLFGVKLVIGIAVGPLVGAILLALVSIQLNRPESKGGMDA